jgi:hypothetical protein
MKRKLCPNTKTFILLKALFLKTTKKFFYIPFIYCIILTIFIVCMICYLKMPYYINKHHRQQLYQNRFENTPHVIRLQITSSTDLTRQQNLLSNPPTPRVFPTGKAFLTLWTQPCSTQTVTPTSSKQGNTTDLMTGPLQ